MHGEVGNQRLKEKYHPKIDFTVDISQETAVRREPFQWSAVINLKENATDK